MDQAGSGMMSDMVVMGRERPAGQDFASLFRSAYPGVVRTVFYIVQDRQVAEELAQDAFVELFTRWGRVGGYDRPDAWVRRVAIRRAQRARHREQRRAPLERRALAAAEVAELSAPDQAVLDAVRTLPRKQRAVVALFYLEDRPMEEIADLVGCSVSSGWSQLHTARRRLAALLVEEVNEG